MEEISLQNSRLKFLTQEDLDKLQVIARQGYLLSSSTFWLTVENSLENENARVQMHKCTCGQIIIASPEYIQSCKDKYLKEKKAICWHEEGVADSIQSLNSMVSRRVDHIVATFTEDVRLSMSLSKGLLPTENLKNFDYSLFRLEFLIWKQKALLNKEKVYQYKNKFLAMVSKLQVKANKKSEKEFSNLIKFYTDPQVVSKINESIQIALDKHTEAVNIVAEEAYKRITRVFSPTTRSLTGSKSRAERLNIQILLDSYQAFFEIREVLEIIYNLISIQNGEPFRVDPFKGKKVNGNSIDDSKAYMVLKILEDTNDAELKRIISSAYDNKLRNNTAGHNSYLLNLKSKKVVIKNKSINYSFKYIRDKEEKITSLATTLLSAIMMTKHFNHTKELSLMGIHSFAPKVTETNAPLPDLVVMQYWSNADLDKKGEDINLLNLKFSKDRKFVFFSHNELMPENASLFYSSKQLLNWLNLIKDKDEMHYHRMIIAPKIELFLKNAKGELDLSGDKFFVLGETHHKLKIIKPKIKKMVKILKKKNLIEIPISNFGNVFSAVKMYKDEKIK